MTVRKSLRCPAELATLIYHDVIDDLSDSGLQRPASHPYTHGKAEFASHLKMMADLGTRPEVITDINLEEAGKHLLLTFDDGGESAILIANALSRMGWKGHFLVTTGRIGSQTFLSAAEIKYLRGCGHLIGSHSHTHPAFFRQQSWEGMMREWSVSRDILSQLLGEPILAASVPGGSVSGKVLRSAEAAGFRYLFTSEPWLHPRRQGRCSIIGRICIKAGDSPAKVAQLARSEGWSRVWVAWRLKSSLKLMAGPLYRYYLLRTAHQAAGAGGQQEQNRDRERAA